MGTARFVLIVLAGLLVLAPSNGARADELTRVYALILRNPTDTALNMRYAALAEARGEYRKALAAYERVLLNDPNNEAARAALQRVRRKLQPDITQIFAEFGGAWESNPRRVPFGARSEWEARARVMVRDERKLGDVRWRTLGMLMGDWHPRNTDLTYGYAEVLTGPVTDLSSSVAMYAALGGAAAYFDRRFFHADAIAALTFESYLEGALQSVRVRGAYRQYNDFFPSNRGFYADIVGRFARPDLIVPGGVLIFSPWLRWSGINGAGITINFDGVQPGRYVEAAGRLEYYQRLAEWLSVGANFGVIWRRYALATNLVTGLVTRRRDFIYYPGAAVIVHRVFGHQTDIRLDYRYERDNSTDPFSDYVNHLVTLMFVKRF